MLILKEKQVKKYQLKLIKENKKIPGFIYLNRLFMPLEYKKYHEWETVIPEYKRWLLEENIFCLILKQSDFYSIWCFAPNTARIIDDFELSSEKKQDKLATRRLSDAIA